jgi:allantoicase
LADGRTSPAPALEHAAWIELLPRTALQPHARHEFEGELRAAGDVTHVRFNIFPDGGVARLRLFGRPGDRP